MHTEQLGIVRDHYEKTVPRSWVTGGTEYQKAAVLAAIAWHQIKPAEDPDLKDCDLTFREQCIGVAHSIIRDNEPDETAFAQQASKLWRETDDYRSTHKEIKAP